MLASLVAALLTVAPMREAVALASTIEDLKQRLAATELVDIEEVVGGPEGQLHFKLRKPVPAREFAAAMKWEGAYIVTTDVHQSRWHLMLRHEDLGDNRFAPVEPAIGSWVFTRVRVDGPPDSDALPPLSIPGSPAYDVESYAANVTGFTIEVLDPERHRVAYLLTDDLAKLREGIASAKTVDALKEHLAKSPLIEKVEERAGRIEVRLRKPVSAAACAKAMQWKRPYIIGDLHQLNWRLVLWQSDMKDPYGPRIATAEPKIGNWVFVDVVIADRPIGELPKLSAGASVAFDARKHAAEVIAFSIEAKNVRRNPVH